MIGLTTKNQWLVMYDRFNFVINSHFNSNCNRHAFVYSKNGKGKIKMKIFYKKDYEKALIDILKINKEKANLVREIADLKASEKYLQDKKSEIEKELAITQQELIEANAKGNDLSLENKKLKEVNSERKTKIINIQQDLAKANAKNSDYELALTDLKKSNRILASSKGGYGTSVRKLKEKIKLLEDTNSNLKQENDELKSDRYVLKKIPSGRTPKSQEMKSKHSVTTKSNVSKFIKEEHLSL